MRRPVTEALYIAWCASWLPTIIYAMSEGGPDSLYRQKVQVGALTLMAVYYLFGFAWACRRSWHARPLSCGRLIAAWAVWLYCSAVGPISLLFFSRVLAARRSVEG
jgi:hypothetical protein